MNCKNKKKKKTNSHNNNAIKAEQNTQFAARNVVRWGLEKGAEKKRAKGSPWGKQPLLAKHFTAYYIPFSWAMHLG